VRAFIPKSEAIKPTAVLIKIACHNSNLHWSYFTFLSLSLSHSSAPLTLDLEKRARMKKKKFMS
jgi:hypothetical protein